MPLANREQVAGFLVGGAVGDALGLPYEGLSRQRQARLRRGRPLKHRLLFGRGMISDDTEHAAMTAQAWLASQGSADTFGRSLAWRLRWWLLGVPAATGFATLRSILKLWLGFSYRNSGVHSAGNGPAMRSGILGLLIDDPDEMRQWVSVCTKMTHTDPRALQGALVIAHAARIAYQQPQRDRAIAEMRRVVADHVHDDSLARRLAIAMDAAATGAQPDVFLQQMDCPAGVSGFINDTVPAAVYCWLRYIDNFTQGVTTAVALGGDTDSVAALVGSLLATHHGVSVIPQAWVRGIADWPRSIHWLQRLADRLATASTPHAAAGPLPLFWPMLPIRNLAFAGVVILHGFRRLSPPY